jgi:hypothetical protein
MMTFDPAFGLTPGATLPCTATYGFSGTAVCTVDTTGNVIEMTGAFISTDYLLILTIQGIVNPPYEKNFSIFVASYTSANALIEQSGFTNFSFRTEPGKLTCTITNLGSDIVAEYTDISVSFTVTNEVE